MGGPSLTIPTPPEASAGRGEGEVNSPANISTLDSPETEPAC